MEENKSAIPARMTRSRRASVESPVASPAKKTTRSRKLKNIDENEPENVSRHENANDFDDAASNASSNSMKSCKVVLRREKFDDINTNTTDMEDRSIAQNTRARRSSQLTEENVSAAYSSAPRRSLRSGSVISDATETTQLSRSLSTRLASQNTPKKENAARPMTPGRRSSRLLSENEKAAESPAKITPARRNLRSSSVASEDLSPPQVRRASSRLTESQGTPKSLKNKVSKIKAEPTTPRRTSMRMNKSIIATDIIDEEPTDEEIDGAITGLVNKSKEPSKNIIEEIEEEEEEEVKIEKKQELNEIKSNASKDGGNQREEQVIIDDEPEPMDIKPTLTEEQKSAAVDIVASSSDLVNSPHAEAAIGSPISKSTFMPSSPVILITTSTAKSPKSTTPLPTAQTPTVKPSEPMETSTTEVVEPIVGTPKGKVQTIVESSKTPRINSPKIKTVSSDLDSMDVTGMINESVLSPAPMKSKENSKKNNVSMAEATEMEIDAIKPEKWNINGNKQATSVNVSSTGPSVSIDLDKLDTVAAPEADKGDAKQEIAYTNKTLENVKCSETSTPKLNPKPTTPLESLNISVLAQEHESQKPTPTSSKKALKRQSMKVSVQSTGSNETGASILVEESVENDNKNKSVMSKSTDSPKVAKITPVKSAKSTPIKAKTPKSSAKTDKSINQKDEEIINDESVQSPMSFSTSLFRPPRKSSFGGISASLSEEINKLLIGLETPEAKKGSETTMAGKDIDQNIDQIASAITPSDSEVIDRRFAEIAADLTPTTPKVDEQQSSSTDGIQEITTVDTVQEVTIEAEKHDTTTDKDKENNSAVEVKDVSIVNATQPELEATTPVVTSSVLEGSKVSTSKKERKSVQIMTPVVDKSHKMSEKRFDTPYPDDKSISEASTNRTKSEEQRMKREEMRAEARENLKKLSESWNKSIKRNSLSNQSPKPIDADTSGKMEEKSAKKAVPARNNWSTVVDTESEPEEDDLIPESDEGTDGEEEESENEFFDSVDVIEDYESGDSMDEEERREMKDNEIEEGMDIGSDDTEYEDDDDEYEDDGFIVNEEVFTDASDASESSDEEEEIIVIQNPKRKASRVIESSSSEESDIESTEDSNDAVAVAVEQVSSVIVVHNQPSTDAEEELIEGRTFPTTYLMPVEDDEDEVKSVKVIRKVKSPKSSAQTNVLKRSDEKETKENQQEIEVSTQLVRSIDEGASKMVNELVANEQNVAITAPETSASEKDDETADKNGSEPEKAHTTFQQTASSSMDQLDGKENQKTTKKIKNRTSLPGIDRLPKSSIVKKNSRMSLGDLNPNAQNISITQLKTQSSKSKASEKRRSENKNVADNEMASAAEEASNVSLRPSTTNDAPLDISSQEENNNNEKASKVKIVEQTQSDEQIIPRNIYDVVELVGEEGHDVVTSTSEHEAATLDVNEIKSKTKRKFIEIDVDEEVHEQAKPKKLLRIINSASGKFIEEPMTPEKKNKFGFRELPRTPVNHDFKVQKRVQYVLPRSNKRKSVYLNEDDEVDLLLPQPKWKINTQFEEEQPKKRARKLDLGSTEVILKPLPPKKKKPVYLVPVELARYRHNLLYRAGIPRQESRALLRERQKRMA